MNKDEKLKIIEDMQAVVEQMRLDDLEEDPSLADEMILKFLLWLKLMHMDMAVQ